MSNEKTTYAELNLTKKSKKQQIKPRGAKGFTSGTEQEIYYAELNLQNATQSPQANDKNYHCKGLLSPPEKLIAGVLGIICFVLVCIITITVIITHSTQTLRQNNSSTINTTSTQKAENNSLETHCAHCPPEGFTYSNNCYYTNHEKMSWTESVVACASGRSSLLYIESEKELKFPVSILPPSWVGIFHNSTHHPWMSINGSTTKLKIKDNSAGEYNCVIVFSDDLHAEICTYPNFYYCKHKLQN
ncbi:NKG2-A/NKG2-B type II integral membrane protein-like [Sorex araneus]|uniref:NKG2-A/NKG2-B type II integral membrane protein-like n=1 Tax=Sorex araneus TaxID=42254 RepID=UPI002433B88C|nr:NKG2-A/NKG2-B type II integral membrane protein-like [Sorex araneus]